MNNEYEDIKHFVANNDEDTIARVWVKEIETLKGLIEEMEELKND